MALTTRPGTPDPRQELAFGHADVVTIADALLRHQELALLRLARQAIISPNVLDDGYIRRLLGSAATTPVMKAARRIAAAGNRIAREPDLDLKGRRKGAVLERLVHGLVLQREATEREAEIQLTRNPHTRRPWSRPKEVVVPSANPVEVYECKFNGRGLEQPDVDELGDIDLTARAGGTGSRACVAIMASKTTLDAARPGLRLSEPLYFAELDDLLDLRYRPSSRQL